MSAHAVKRHGHGGGHDPHALGRGETPLSERGPAPKQIVVAYGFLDLPPHRLHHVFRVLRRLCGAGRETAGGPSGRELFDLSTVAWETGFLLLSSFACGLAGIAAMERRAGLFQIAMAVTALFGAAFPRARGDRVQPPDRRGQRAAAQRLFVVVLRARGLPRRPCDARPLVADGR